MDWGRSATLEEMWLCTFESIDLNKEDLYLASGADTNDKKCAKCEYFLLSAFAALPDNLEPRPQMTKSLFAMIIQSLMRRRQGIINSFLICSGWLSIKSINSRGIEILLSGTTFSLT